MLYFCSMMQKKPTLEKITPNFGSSFLLKKHEEFLKTNTPFWHFHPEIELVYVNKGKGKRHIGNHISYFNNSQLVLIGSNLPHIGYLDRLTTNGSETLIDLEGANRITSFIEILNDLATTDDYTLLNANGYAFESSHQDSNKIELVYKHINENFKDHISLDEVSELVSMTVPAFCRYFKKSTGKTFTKLVNEYRVVHATKLLAESTMSITDISFECGFNNFSHFNKLFKEFTGKSASVYRNELKNLIQ